MTRATLTVTTGVTLNCPRCGGSGRIPDPRAQGAAMRDLRQKAGLSLRDLAQRLRLSMSYVSDLELGRRSWRDELRERYLKALKAA